MPLLPLFPAWCQPISIAYSVKAKGINQDLLGSCDFVLETPSVNAGSLWEYLKKLMHHEIDFRSKLHSQMIHHKERVSSAFSIVAQKIG